MRTRREAFLGRRAKIRAVNVSEMPKIAHLFSIVRYCDRLVRAREGKAAPGTWDDLYRSNAELRRLVDQRQQGASELAVNA